jgi:hypothetical protein
MTIKYTSIFYIPRLSKIYQNWDFWFENKPSGNPARKQSQSKSNHKPVPDYAVDEMCVNID